jgi:hypothetical protein
MNELAFNNTGVSEEVLQVIEKERPLSVGNFIQTFLKKFLTDSQQ